MINTRTRSVSVIAVVAASAIMFAASVGSAARAQTPNTGAPINIGALFDLTGSNASVGTNVRNATQMAVDEVNAAGGVNGRKINLDIQDEASDSAKGVTAFNLLHSQKNIDVMFGATFTGAAVAIADVAQKQGVLLYSSSATSPVLTNPTRKYIFAANQTAVLQARGIVTLINSMGAKKIALIEETDAYGAQGKDSLTAAIKADGDRLSIVTNVNIAPNATDATSQISAIKSSGADVVVIAVILNPAVAIIKAAKQQGLALPIVSFGGGTGPATDELLSGDAPLEYYAPTPLACPLTGSCVSDVVARYKAKFNSAPSVWGMQGYAAAQHFIQALRNIKGEITADSVAAQLESMIPFTTPIIPVPMKFSADNHLAITTTYFTGFKGGKPAFLGNDVKANKL